MDFDFAVRVAYNDMAEFSAMEDEADWYVVTDEQPGEPFEGMDTTTLIGHCSWDIGYDDEACEWLTDDEPSDSDYDDIEHKLWWDLSRYFAVLSVEVWGGSI